MSKVLKLAETTFGAGSERVAKNVEMVAADIASGCFGNVRNVIMLIENYDGGLERVTLGDTIDRARATGLLTIMAARMATDAYDAPASIG